MSKPDKLITTASAARRLNVSRRQIYNLVHEKNTLKPARGNDGTGSNWQFHLSDVEKLIRKPE